MQKWMYKNKNKKGFTLIELVVVIAILGILSAIAIPRFTGFQEASRQKADQANAKTIANVISVLIANGDISADVGPVTTTGVDKIEENFPGGAIPTFQTTAVKDEVFFYTVDIDDGEVTITSGTTSKEIYPTPDTTTFDELD